MSIAVRGWFTANNAHTSVTSVATAYTSWTTANPVVGDLLVCVILWTASGETISQASGTGSWTIPASNSNAAAGIDPFTSAIAYRVYASGDTAPTFHVGTTTAYAYLMFALHSTVGGGTVTFDAEGTVKVDTAAATGHTPNTAVASTAQDMAIVLNAARAQATGATAITMTTPCSGFTAIGIGGYGGASSFIANSVSAYYKTPVGTGTITPGAETFGGQSVANNAYTLLVKEFDPPETSPGLEVYGFPVAGPGSGDTINSVTVSVTEHQSNAAQLPCTFQLWDGTSAQIGATQTGTASTSAANVSRATFTGVTYAQLPTLRVRVYGNATAGSGYIESVDAVSLVVNYTPTPIAGTAAAVTVAAPAGAAAGTSGTVNVTGVPAAVTVAAPAGAAAGAGAVTGTAAPVTAASPAGVAAGSVAVTGTAAPAAVACPAGVAFGGTSGSVNVTGAAAPVTVAAPPGVPASAANITGASAPVTAAAPAGVPSGSGTVTGTAAPAAVASPAGVLAAGVSVTGLAAPVTAACPAGTPHADQNITGAAAPVTATGGTGTAFGSSPNASVSGVAATVTVAAPAGVPHSGSAVTGTAAPVTAGAPAGTPAGSGPANVTGTAAHVTAASPAGTTAGSANVTGTGAPVLAPVPAGALAAAANLTGLAALITILGGAGSAVSIVKASSSPAVTATGTSTATVTAHGTSKPSIR